MTTRDRVMSSPETRRLTREVIALAETRDVVDAYYDVKLALQVIKERMDAALGREVTR